MNIDHFKHDHLRILDSISDLRRLSHRGIEENAPDIARAVVAMSSVIKLHLSAEDRMLYPALQASGNERLALLGQQFQQEMESIAASFAGFVRRWNTPARVRTDPEGFRSDANQILKSVHARMQRENRDFYPLIERESSPLEREYVQ